MQADAVIGFRLELCVHRAIHSNKRRKMRNGLYCWQDDFLIVRSLYNLRGAFYSAILPYSIASNPICFVYKSLLCTMVHIWCGEPFCRDSNLNKSYSGSAGATRKPRDLFSLPIYISFSLPFLDTLS